MEKLIINADDFGHSIAVTDAIIYGFKAGYIDRTTIMVNMPDFERAVKLAEKLSITDKVGLHLNLTEGYPLTDIIKEEVLFCNPLTGAFNKNFRRNLINRLYFSEKTASAVAKEIEAQILKFKSINNILPHVDSHHHVHKDYSIFKILLPLMKKNSLSSIRIANNTTNGCTKIYNKWINNRIKENDFVQPASDYLFSCLSEVKNQYSGVVEVEVHPTFVNGVLKDHDTEFSIIRKFRGRG